MESIDNRMYVLGMINTLNANMNVGWIMIKVDISIEQNSEVVRMMVDRFTNVYYIAVVDENDKIDDGVHRMIK